MWYSNPPIDNFSVVPNCVMSLFDEIRDQKITSLDNWSLSAQYKFNCETLHMDSPFWTKY